MDLTRSLMLKYNRDIRVGGMNVFGVFGQRGRGCGRACFLREQDVARRLGPFEREKVAFSRVCIEFRLLSVVNL